MQTVPSLRSGDKAKRPCLDHFIFLGERFLRKAVENYVEHYHHERNHQGLDNLIPFPYSPTKPDKYSAIRKSDGQCVSLHARLGGLLNYYFRESQPENGKEGPIVCGK